MKRGELRTLYCGLADIPLLSLYLDGRAPDPAMNAAWRLELAAAAERERRVVEKRAPRQVEAFDRALALAREELAPVSGRLPTDGLVLFVSESSVIHREEVHASLSTRIGWKRGPLVAPYLPILAPDGTVLVIDVSWDEATLYRYDGGRTLALLTRFEVEATHEAIQSVGVMKSVKGTSGFRGPSAQDEADRAMRDDRRRMLAAIEASVGARMGPRDHLLLFGSQGAAGELTRMLPASLKQGIHVESLEARRNEARLVQATRRGLEAIEASELRRVLTETQEIAHRNGHGAFGSVSVRRAVNRGAVDTLLVSEEYAHKHAGVAESLLGATYRSGGSVRMAVGEIGAELDEVGAGVAARLRFPVT
jgi:hypothetical protein